MTISEIARMAAAVPAPKGIAERSRMTADPRKSQGNAAGRTVPSFRPESGKKRRRFSGLDRSIRDRDDDWLSAQIKEEERAYIRICDMFGIIPHISDAAVLKSSHERKHRAMKDEI